MFEKKWCWMAAFVQSVEEMVRHYQHIWQVEIKAESDKEDSRGSLWCCLGVSHLWQMGGLQEGLLRSTHHPQAPPSPLPSHHCSQWQCSHSFLFLREYSCGDSTDHFLTRHWMPTCQVFQATLISDVCYVSVCVASCAFSYLGTESIQCIERYLGLYFSQGLNISALFKSNTSTLTDHIIHDFYPMYPIYPILYPMTKYRKTQNQLGHEHKQTRVMNDENNVKLTDLIGWNTTTNTRRVCRLGDKQQTGRQQHREPMRTKGT